ncbi:MAG: flagellar export chaperone FlgN [Clostridiales bacterium]|nr:flagellar export chaperone FlgN [Clostridiales bacterium]
MVMKMENKNYIEILKQDLRKKDEVLDQILDANQRQQDALEDPTLEPDAFDAIVEEKAKLIEKLEALDEGFEQIYARVRDALCENREQYKEDIKELQELIRILTDKNVQIQAGEKKNKALMTRKFAEVRKQVREIRSSQKIVNQYYQNMMKKNFVDPQFLDDKK